MDNLIKLDHNKKRVKMTKELKGELRFEAFESVFKSGYKLKSRNNTRANDPFTWDEIKCRYEPYVEDGDATKEQIIKVYNNYFKEFVEILNDRKEYRRRNYNKRSL